jgi:isoleucyl-tRNA synthetase
MNFNKIEQNVIKYWNDIDLKNQLRQSRKEAPKWEFLDGPPFVNGTPHMGHLLVSSIKDTMARYMSQKGYDISYMIGFDCHGLPLEQEAEKKVGKVSPNDSIARLKEFNDSCRDIISSCSDVWYEQLGRLGRQFDKSQTYYTSDFKFMESLWWAFSKLWKDGLIYKSKKVMPYSPLCETPLSNFEASSNYIERMDLSVYVKFNIKGSDEKLLVWTTTPWSLYGNQGICVNPELDYNLVSITISTTINNMSEKLWVAVDIVPKLFVGVLSDYEVLRTVKGTELVGLEYNPIYTTSDYTYKVYGDSYVKSDSGTGLVHLAPLFGGDDMRVMKNNGYTDDMLPETIINSKCHFTFEPYENKFVIDCNTDIVVNLKKSGYAFKSEKIKHNYPHCWRTDGPLIYLATDAWFMNVQKIIPELVTNNEMIEWVPSYVGTERFANWIKDSPDWCLSRNRVWGTPIPVWVSASDDDMICVESVEQLEQLTGRQFTDLHLDNLSNVEFVKNNKLYKRTFGVLDCWFESGMAGLARYGYPDCIGKSYPVDFIAESLDQTRGWFYTLNVLSTALCHQPAFKKVIVSGLILAADGKKMSKRLQNYTPPDEIIKTYGADILRLYLIGSPAAKAESYCFKDSDLAEINRKILPYYHSHVFLQECLTFTMLQLETNDVKQLLFKPLETQHGCDLWILNKFNEFSNQVYKHMEKLELTYIPNLIYKFIDTLCNTYIKLSRERMKGLAIESLQTLYTVQNKFNLLLAPFMPHLAEHFNNMIVPCDSIHMTPIDTSILPVDKKLLDGFCCVNELIETVRNLRQQINKPNYFPINTVELYINNSIIAAISEFSTIICKELNVKNLVIKPLELKSATYIPNKANIGKIYKKESSKIVEMIEKGDIDGIEPSCYNAGIPQYMFAYSDDYVDVIKSQFSYNSENDIKQQAIVYMSTLFTEDNIIEAEINNIRRQINNMRKEMGLKIHNKVTITFENCEYWELIKGEYLEMLINRLVADVKFQDTLEEYKEIVTFNGKTLKVNII